VRGEAAASTAYAGYFVGKVHVAGALSKSSGTFRIDHPLDPERKYLSHSFVESPDMMNVYNGNVSLDEAGEAWVELPAYFNALNREFRYQLTSMGKPQPELYILTEVQGNRFQIAGGRSGGRVSWQVTGIRQDAYARQNPVIVEEDKPAEEVVTYLNPEAFGVPAELGAGYRGKRGGSQAAMAETELGSASGNANPGKEASRSNIPKDSVSSSQPVPGVAPKPRRRPDR
jgi:hypothetical protein